MVRIDIAAVEVQVISVVVVVRRRRPVVAVAACIVDVSIAIVAIAIAGSRKSGNLSDPQYPFRSPFQESIRKPSRFDTRRATESISSLRYVSLDLSLKERQLFAHGLNLFAKHCI